MMNEMLSFGSDYMEGAHPEILQRLIETNMEQTAGYGLDEYSDMAREKIRKACRAPHAEIHFLSGGTQVNRIVISALLRPYEGVIAADTGHITVHEAGAIECGGHKVLALPHTDGKLTARAIEECLRSFHEDANHDHMVRPGMVYISHPTEYGTLYTMDELEVISVICRANRIPLFLDGARLAYALGCPVSELTLPAIARLCDAFYIGGTKCGALFGEAVVFPKSDTVPHFFTIVKQSGALLAKGRVLGIQFDTLFTNGLYERGGAHAIAMADRIRAALTEKGYTLASDAPTNQIFLALSPDQLAHLSAHVGMVFWEKQGNVTVMRIATSWATQEEDVTRLIELL
ncbi:beta-eliminating lyase [Selenomonas sp. FOBRC6]|uniref:threonine aldolase family protein n=1 Tax=Selenomonas sp. FOBRC6 TaxID=936572 RepID=UPI000278285C|nr:beta-eliminating lyase [Selenomonas sp. FOBRC6]